MGIKGRKGKKEEQSLGCNSHSHDPSCFAIIRSSSVQFVHSKVMWPRRLQFKIGVGACTF